MFGLIKTIFKSKRNEAIYNIYHPELEGKTEFAFESGGVKYYRFVKDFIMPVGRYKFIDEKLSEADLRMNMPLLRAFINALKSHIDGSKGTINLGEVWKIIYAMETRCNLAFEPETIRQLASVIYFDDTEDLRDYDKDYGQKKIENWTRNGDYSFFLTRPLSELLNLPVTSETSLEKFTSNLKAFIKEAEETVKAVTLDPQTLSVVNLSKSGSSS
jgi:hypothetical protein